MLLILFGTMVVGAVVTRFEQKYSEHIKRRRLRTRHAPGVEVVAELYKKALELQIAFGSWAAAQSAGKSTNFKQVMCKMGELDAYYQANGDQLGRSTCAVADRMVGVCRSRTLEISFVLQNNSFGNRGGIAPSIAGHDAVTSTVQRWLNEELQDAMKELENETTMNLGGLTLFDSQQELSVND